MTIDEAISLLKQYIDYNNPDIPDFYTMEEACEVVIKALEQQPMDAVDRQVVIDAIDDDNRNGHYSCFATNNDAECFKQIIRDLPSVTPQPKMGQWLPRNAFLVPYKCSECNYESERYDNYCPNCGAKMFEPQESEDKE